MSSKKLVYILPDTSKKTHMKYNVEFLKELGKDAEIFLIIEKGGEESFEAEWGEKGSAFFAPSTHIHFLNTNNSLLRIIKTKALLVKALLLGYRKVYIHYSFISAFIASLNPFFETYYWNCGMPWKYKRPYLQELYESATYKLIDHLVTGGEKLGKGYAENYGFDDKNNIIIPNWVNLPDPAKFTDRSILKPQNKKVLLHIHRLGVPWGAMNIIPIALELQKRNVDFFWYVAGDGPLKLQIEDDIQKYSLQNNFKLLGYLPNEEALKYFQITDCFVLPSDSEGFPRSLVEAMSFGVPIAAFSVGSVPDILKVDNLVSLPVQSNDIQKMADQIIKNFNISDEEKIKERQLLQNRVKDFSLEKIVVEYKQKIFI